MVAFNGISAKLLNILRLKIPQACFNHSTFFHQHTFCIENEAGRNSAGCVPTCTQRELLGEGVTVSRCVYPACVSVGKELLVSRQAGADSDSCDACEPSVVSILEAIMRLLCESCVRRKGCKHKGESLTRKKKSLIWPLGLHFDTCALQTQDSRDDHRSVSFENLTMDQRSNHGPIHPIYFKKNVCLSP